MRKTGKMLINKTPKSLANRKRKIALLLIVLAIIPTFIYVVISNLAMPEGNIDMGSTIGSYAGLMLLISAYSSIGIFTSTLSDNQIVAFILSVFFCVSSILDLKAYPLTPLFSTIIAAFGMQDHFKKGTV
jgi:ABC-2 type transport system permease protein